ncbi:MAG: hypothetical protein AAB885_02570 [Patescibacteria group bacterium]
MKFEYKKIELPKSDAFLRGHFALRPIIPVFFKIPNANRKIGYEALVDSGADYNIFPAQIAEIMGLNVKKGRLDVFGGVGGGKYAAYFHKVKMFIGGWEYEIDCGFSYDFAPWGYGIVGQKGFFDLFVIKFDYLKKEIEIKPRT